MEGNNMKKMELIVVILMIFYIASQSAAADKSYVTDTFTITLRTGPSTENKIIRSLSSGQALEVLETQEQWSHVRVVLNSETELDGWVRTQYLMDRTPYELQAKALRSENQRLKESLSKVNRQQASTEKDREDISAEYNNTLSELNSLKNAYESLKNASSEYLALKAEYDDNLSKMKATEDRLNEIEIENATMKKSQSYIWFGTGALVLLFGLVIGSILGRQARKRTSSYY
jgi:SH3 domain protein